MRLPAMTLLAQLLNDLRKYLNCPEATQQMGIYSLSCTLEIKNVFCRFSIVITLISIIFCPKPCSHSHVFPQFLLACKTIISTCQGPYTQGEIKHLDRAVIEPRSTCSSSDHSNF